MALQIIQLPDRPDIAPISRARLIRACRRGELPAEVLSSEDRHDLVRHFWAAGWTDTEIATQTRMTTYTTGRIRDALGFAAHPALEGHVA